MKRLWIPAVAALMVVGCSSSDNSSTPVASGTPAPAAPAAPAAPGDAAGGTAITKPDDKPTYTVVQQVFNTACIKCHGANPQRIAGGIDLTKFDAIMKGGRKGPVIVAGDVTSPLIRAISGTPPSMPKNAAPLAKADVDLITAWVKDGAKGM